MNAKANVLLSAGCAAVVAASFNVFRADREAHADAPADLASLRESIAELSARVEGLQRTQAELTGELGELELQPVASGGHRVPSDEIEAAVERYLAGRADLPEPAPAAEAPEPAMLERDVAKLDLRSIIEALTNEDADYLETEELWQKLRKAGRLDEVIAEFERLAELDPNNPDRRVELGYAYIQKIQEVGAGALAGKWAMQADAEFDRALELDPNHWEARYSKAVSLSFWPAFTGKTGEAIAQLEKLVEIQSHEPIADHHVATYLTLGNIYLGQGKNDMALATWQKGLELFPGNEELAAQIESLGD